jgi:hypothetical protein
VPVAELGAAGLLGRQCSALLSSGPGVGPCNGPRAPSHCPGPSAELVWEVTIASPERGSGCEAAGIHIATQQHTDRMSD